MKKNKIGDIILLIVVVLFLLNSLIAYFSYKKVSDNKSPYINLGVIKKENVLIYNQGLYKIVVEENNNLREVSLKLFFLK